MGKRRIWFKRFAMIFWTFQCIKICLYVLQVKKLWSELSWKIWWVEGYQIWIWLNCAAWLQSNWALLDSYEMIENILRKIRKFEWALLTFVWHPQENHGRKAWRNWVEHDWNQQTRNWSHLWGWVKQQRKHLTWKMKFWERTRSHK